MRTRQWSFLLALLGCLCLLAACSGNTGPAPSPSATPSSTASPPPATLEAGSFRYEIHGAVERTAEGGERSNNTSPWEHILLFGEKGWKSDVTLYFPLDLGTGPHVMDAFTELVTEGRVSASSAIDNGHVFYAEAGGSLAIEFLVDGKLSGSFQFNAVDRADPTSRVSVSGSFREIPLPIVP
ncbi:MAG: hypothetical protein NTV14_08080 [Coprothermobacterota bacterium]|nr:hypothetical protein [Coprothermobacterota bacterium]